MTCGQDDSGKCCGGRCQLNPIAVIATYQREYITTKNIIQILKQNCKVIVVVSDDSEVKYYRERFPEITVIKTENNPIGRKWQHGVEKARELGANPLVIVGSDDILRDNYIEKALNLIIKGADFVGLTSWFTYDWLSGKVFNATYQGVNENFPIGSGKVISKKFLEISGWKVFDTSANRKLDDLSYKMAITRNAKIEIIRTPEVLAVKGNWKVLNSADDYLTSPNIKTEIADKEILKQFGI